MIYCYKLIRNELVSNKAEADNVQPLAQKASFFSGAYLVPYFILLLIIGIPLFFLELAVGQKIRRGSIGVWNYVCPSLGGIGMSSLMVRGGDIRFQNIPDSTYLMYVIRIREVIAGEQSMQLKQRKHLI